MVNVCVPVLKRYDLLRVLLHSLDASTVRPDHVYVIDNGQSPNRVLKATYGIQVPVEVIEPDHRLGLADAWNWFIAHVPEERVIVNDDIQFAPESLKRMLEAPAPFVSCSFGFSCFILRDECIAKVGSFDETLSPGYAYFEDMDYLRRMKAAGIVDDVVQCGVLHAQSATPQAYSQVEWQEHHRRFQIAEANYTRKWADGPSWDQLKTIGGEGSHV